MAPTTNLQSGDADARSSITARLEETQREAEAGGLPRYEAWCAALERRYTVMPLWYWDSEKRRDAYAAHVRATLEWQRKQARINDGNRRFLKSLYGSLRPSGESH